MYGGGEGSLAGAGGGAGVEGAGVGRVKLDTGLVTLAGYIVSLSAVFS
jgi:hypothetical protein